MFRSHASFAVTIVAPKRYLTMKRSLLHKDQILDVAFRSTTVFFPPVAQAGRHCEIALERNRFRLKRFRSSILMEHDLFGKPVSTFPDHALTAVK
jgi:hypothetical protein